MPLPPPTPSRIALRALQGVAFGTSATLVGLTIASQLQRIRIAQSRLENKRKLKAHKNYHATSGDPLLAKLREDGRGDGQKIDVASFSTLATAELPHRSLEDLASVDLGLFDLQNCLSGIRPAPSIGWSNSHISNPLADRPRIQGPIPKQRPQEAVVVGPHAKDISTAVNPEDAGPADQQEDIARRVVCLMSDIEPRKVHEALQLIRGLLSARDDAKPLCASILSAAVPVTRALYDSGNVVDAASLVERLVARGPLDEEAFLAFEPFKIIDGLMAADHVDLATRLKMSKNIFLAKLSARPMSSYDDLRLVGALLISRSLETRQLARIDDVFRRVNPVRKRDYKFVEFYIGILHYHGESKTAANRFIQLYPKINPDISSFETAANTVVNAVDAASGYRAAEVLRVLLDTSKRLSNKFRASWFRKLGIADWKGTRSIAGARSMFALLQTEGVLELVDRPELALRSMIDISLLAGEKDMAEKYFMDLSAISPDPRTIIRARGARALQEAKLGNWIAVEDEFNRMKELLRAHHDVANRVFVTVLGHYARTHDISEVESFVTHFVKTYEIEPSRHLVTSMAAQYAKKGELAALRKWLESARDSGFPLDATACNTILHGCHRRWKVPFSELQELFAAMKLADASLVDDATERIMHAAARSHSQDHGGRWSPKLQPTRGAPDRQSEQKSPTDAREVYKAMEDAIAAGNHAVAIQTYKRARRHGMAPNSHCLRLVSQASAHLRDDHQDTLDFLKKEACSGNVNLEAAMAPLARLDLDLIARSPSKDVPHQVNAMIQRYEAQGIQLPDVVLNQIARLCLRKGHPNEAISFCELAAQRSGNRPGYNVYNFCVLLSAYVRLLHIGGLQALVARLVESDFCTELLSLEQLQDAQRWLDARRTGRSGETAVDRAAELVSLALRHVLAKREELAAERAEVQRQVLEMVEDHGRRRRAEVESDGADTGIADQSSPGVAVL